MIRRLGLMAILPALALGACTSGYDPYDRNQRALTGTALGAGAGALIGSLSGNAGRGALIGGALGTVAGALTPPPAPAAPAYGGYYQQPQPSYGYAQQPAYGGYAQQQAYGYAQQPSGWYDQAGQYHPGPPPFGLQ